MMAAAVAAAIGVGVMGAQAATPPSEHAHAAVRWPAPSDPMRRSVLAGLTPERKESLRHHVHSHLDVFVSGRPIVVPAAIGINIRDPGVHRFKDADGLAAWGGINLCRKPCISPLHTHDRTGILHTESATRVPNTLGQFFTEWGVRLNGSCVGPYCRPLRLAFYVNGRRYAKDPRTIRLTDHKEIAIAIGRPPTHVPRTADFSDA